MVKIPAVPKPSKTYVAGQREKQKPPSRPVRVVEAEEVENVRAELVKVPENCLEMQPVVTAAAASLADGLGSVVKQAFGPGAKVKQMRLKSGVRTEEAKIKKLIESEDIIKKLIELITQGGSFDYTITLEEDLPIPIPENAQIDNIVVEAGTTIAIAIESTPIKTVPFGYELAITCPLVAKLSLDFADGAEIQVPFSSLGCCDWCASCKDKPLSACCESGGCCVKGGECACWTEPYLVLRPRALELDLPLTLSVNDSFSLLEIASILANRDWSKLFKTLVVAVTERPYIKAKAALRCCRDWICFPFMQLFSLCANTCLLPCVLRGLSKRLVGMTFGPGADKA